MASLFICDNCYANFVQSLKALGFDSYYVSPGIGMTNKEEPVFEASAGYTNSIFLGGGLYSSWTHVKESDKGWRMNSGLQLSCTGFGIEAGYTYFSKSNKGFIYGIFMAVPFKGLLLSFSYEEYPEFQPYLVLFYRYAPDLTEGKYKELGLMLKYPLMFD